MAWFDDEDDYPPPVAVGTQITMQLRDASYWVNGVKHTSPARPFRMTVCAPDDCYPVDPDTFDSDKSEPPHTQTVCTGCIPSWWTDYYIIYTRDETRIDV